MCSIRGKTRRGAFTNTPCEIKPFFIDKYPVTNAQFKEFLDATHYAPRDGIDFLRDWKDGTYPQGWDSRPGDLGFTGRCARLCAWAGKRLPHEWEWQLAAQGTDGRALSVGQHVPARECAFARPGTAPCAGPIPSMRIPPGASPYGVMDMVGNVWQWTDEFTDEHTRAAIVRGGSYYQPQGSIWYFPAGLSQ